MTKAVGQQTSAKIKSIGPSTIKTANVNFATLLMQAAQSTNFQKNNEKIAGTLNGTVNQSMHDFYKTVAEPLL